MSDILTAIFGAWDGLRAENVVNTFADHTAISSNGRAIAYVAPQDIQDDQDIRVVLCKDAISTGWDCPRAEVLVSLRSASDYTYIAQLIGRMVRTPLARRIATDQTLNDVHCYLPRFNKAQVNAIVDRFAEGQNDEPPVEMIVNPVTLERNDAVPQKVFDLLAELPTYVVPGRIYRTQVSRLHMLATLLSGDHIVEDAIAQIRIHLNSVLKGQRSRLESDGTFQKSLARISNLRIERSYVLLAAETMDDLPEQVAYDVPRDDNNIEDLYRVAKRKLPEGVAINFWNEVINEQGDDDYDPTGAKAITVVLALHPEVVEAVETASEQLVQTWLKQHQHSISKLADAKKALYEPVKRETRNPELTDLILPSLKTVPDTDQRWPKHVIADENGLYPAPAKGWEIKVLERELADDDLVGWYRNPTGWKVHVCVCRTEESSSTSRCIPTFSSFTRQQTGLRPSLIDPHGFHLADAAGKLKGLAEYAAIHGDMFDRIEAVAEVDKVLLALNLKSEAVRDAVAKVKDGEVKALFEKLGGDYS